MTMPSYDLGSVTQASVDEVKAVLRQAIIDYSNSYDLDRGVIADIVLELTSLLTAATEQEVDAVRISNSLAEVTSNPTAVSDSVVDEICSNYRVTRKAGTKASGTVAVVLSTNSTVTIYKGSLFTISGLSFQAKYTITAKPVGQNPNPIVLPYARVMTNVGNRYVFLVDVEAVTEGSGGNIPSNIPATMATPPQRFLQAYTYSSLTGGSDKEGNQQLINRLLAGASIQAWGSRTSLEGMLRTQYPAMTNVSVIGAGDAEMLRDKHGVVPISLGGKTDVYLRYNAFYETKVISATATLKAKAGSVGTWEFVIERDTAPGFYDVQKILLPTKLLTETGFTPTSDTRSLDTSGTIYIPDLAASLEGVYSRYQKATIRFDDNITNASALTTNVSTASYQVVIRYMPEIATVQEWLGDVTRRSLSSDVLVKAPVPVYTSITFNLLVPKANATPNEAAVKSAISAAVHAQGFSDTLTESVISSAIRSVISNANIGSLVMAGSLRKPNGTVVGLTGTSSLDITPDTANMVSADTVIFYLAVSDINMTVVRV